MPDKTAQEIAGVVEGAALVEAADSTAVQNTFQELAHVFGPNIDLTHAEQTEIGQAIGHGIDIAQGLTLPVATGLFMYAGLKKMFSGFSKKADSR